MLPLLRSQLGTKDSALNENNYIKMGIEPRSSGFKDLLYPDQSQHLLISIASVVEVEGDKEITNCADF